MHLRSLARSPPAPTTVPGIRAELESGNPDGGDQLGRSLAHPSTASRCDARSRLLEALAAIPIPPPSLALSERKELRGLRLQRRLALLSSRSVSVPVRVQCAEAEPMGFSRRPIEKSSLLRKSVGTLCHVGSSEAEPTRTHRKLVLYLGHQIHKLPDFSELNRYHLRAAAAISGFDSMGGRKLPCDWDFILLHTFRTDSLGPAVYIIGALSCSQLSNKTSPVELWDAALLQLTRATKKHRPAWPALSTLWLVLTSAWSHSAIWRSDISACLPRVRKHPSYPPPNNDHRSSFFHSHSHMACACAGRNKHKHTTSTSASASTAERSVCGGAPHGLPGDLGESR